MTQFFKPETGHPGQNFSFAGDGVRKNDIKCRDAVGGDNQKIVVTDGVDISHFAAPK